MKAVGINFAPDDSGGAPLSKPGQEITRGRPSLIWFSLLGPHARGSRGEAFLRRHLRLLHLTGGSAVQFDFYLLFQVLVVILKNFHDFGS
jgi:hypothetical protein